jgi:hypothetical protein
MPLLSIIQDAYLELGLSPAPTTVIGNTDPQVQQLLALANQEGQEFCKLQGPWGGWPELNQTYTFNLAPYGPFTGTLTNNSAIITGMAPADTAVLAAAYNSGIGLGVAGSNIYQSATVTAIGSTTVTMSAVASGTTAGASINFGQIQYPTSRPIFAVSLTPPNGTAIFAGRCWGR